MQVAATLGVDLDTLRASNFLQNVCCSVTTNPTTFLV
jgi:hypothetical protein